VYPGVREIPKRDELGSYARDRKIRTKRVRGTRNGRQRTLIKTIRDVARAEKRVVFHF